MRGHGVAMPMLARMIGAILEMSAEDRTGLSGFYDVDLDWTEPVNPTGLDTRDAGAPGSTMFSALEDTFGLRLTRERLRVPVVVVEHAEKASEN